MDTDTAEESALMDLVAKGTRRALKHLNLIGTLHLDEMASWPVNSKFVVLDPWTHRDNVHRTYYPHHKEGYDETSESPIEREKVGNLDSAPKPALILKTLPLGLGTVVSVVLENNSYDVAGHSKP